MMLELAIGDAYGAGFEYATEMLEYNDLSRYVQHPRHRGTRPGMYTDDTQMSLAICEQLLSDEEWSRERLASRFADVFHRDQREGYAGGFPAFLKKTQCAAAFLRHIRPDSDKSGAAMRAGCLGLLPEISEVKRLSELQSTLTHNTASGIASAQAAALMVHAAHYGCCALSETGKWLVSEIGGRWDEAWNGKVKSKGWMSVSAALTALQRNTSMSQLLLDCISFKGDVDTVATIALAAASASTEYRRDLPAVLIDTLENGSYGRDYLISLDDALARKFPCLEEMIS